MNDSTNEKTKWSHNFRLLLGIGFIVIGIIVQVISYVVYIRNYTVNEQSYIYCRQIRGLTLFQNGCAEYLPSLSLVGLWIALLGVNIVIAHLTGRIASKKGRDYSINFLVGFFFSIIGLAVVASLGEKQVLKVNIDQKIDDRQISKLIKLKELKDQGVISDAEFEEQKRKFLEQE
jgi:hypothetical protein